MVFRARSAAVYGIDALAVDIEANLRPSGGEFDTSPNITIVGLPDTAVRESREASELPSLTVDFSFR